MYSNAQSHAWVNGQYSEYFGVGIGVHQGCVLRSLLFILVPRFSEPNLSIFECSHNLPWRLDPAARTQEPAKPKTLLVEVASKQAPMLHLPAPPKTVLLLVTIMLSWDRGFHRGICPTGRPNFVKLWPPILPPFPVNQAMCSTIETKVDCIPPQGQQHRHHTCSM